MFGGGNGMMNMMAMMGHQQQHHPGGGRFTEYYRAHPIHQVGKFRDPASPVNSGGKVLMPPSALAKLGKFSFKVECIEGNGRC